MKGAVIDLALRLSETNGLMQTPFTAFSNDGGMTLKQSG
jgi:hypothetical protein